MNSHKKVQTCGIAIDAWKLQLFKKRLKKAGYNFEKKVLPDPDTLMLVVKTKYPLLLQHEVEKINAECAAYNQAKH